VGAYRRHEGLAWGGQWVITLGEEFFTRDSTNTMAKETIFRFFIA